jgi:hypothetical protein
MNGSDLKANLQFYLQTARQALLWKLEGLSEYDARRPMTSSGTNLLGLVKHVASVESGYLGDTFWRPAPESLPWLEADAEPNADMWATAGESKESIVDLYHRVWAHSDATIDALALDDIGRVPWWPPERSEPSGCAPTTTTWRRATRRGGRTTGTGWSGPPWTLTEEL